MKFFKRKKTSTEPLPNIRESSLRVQRHENTQDFSSAYKNIIQESMDATVAPLLSRDNPGTSEKVIMNETGNATEHSIESYDNTLLQFPSPINLPASSQIQDETVTVIQPDITTLLNQRRSNEILSLIKGASFVGFFYFIYVWYGWEFLSSLLLLLLGFAGGYVYFLISTVIKVSKQKEDLKRKALFIFKYHSEGCKWDVTRCSRSE